MSEEGECKAVSSVTRSTCVPSAPEPGPGLCVRPDCPICGAPAVPVHFGLPTQAAREAAEDGALILGGNVLPSRMPIWACADGHRWSGGDDRDRVALIHRVLRGRPRCPLCTGLSVRLVYPPGRELFDLLDVTDGTAVLSHTPGPAGLSWQQLCLDCHHVWTPDQER
ncbi:MAG: hypothetical protein QG608_1391 [Actinomycetota bacterium]|nr:hypothetical protein [Actinomycetota bacterium]